MCVTCRTDLHVRSFRLESDQCTLKKSQLVLTCVLSQFVQSVFSAGLRH